MTDIELEHILEGMLFTMGNSVETTRLADALEVPAERVSSCLDAMKEKWDKEQRGIRIVKLEDSYQMCTSRDIYGYLVKLAKQPRKQVLTDALLETLAIVAYRQPVTRAEIEKIRGVSCEHAVNKLIEYELIEELGRLDAPGRPVLFGTTEQFLRAFGVSSLDELPPLAPDQVAAFRDEAREEALQISEDANSES